MYWPPLACLFGSHLFLRSLFNLPSNFNCGYDPGPLPIWSKFQWKTANWNLFSDTESLWKWKCRHTSITRLLTQRYPSVESLRRWRRLLQSSMATLSILAVARIWTFPSQQLVCMKDFRPHSNILFKMVTYKEAHYLLAAREMPLRSGHACHLTSSLVPQHVTQLEITIYVHSQTFSPHQYVPDLSRVVCRGDHIPEHRPTHQSW